MKLVCHPQIRNEWPTKTPDLTVPDNKLKGYGRINLTCLILVVDLITICSFALWWSG